MASIVLLLSYASTATASQTHDIIMNEVMYNPLTADDTNEWIELYNPTNNSIDLTGWTLTDDRCTDSLGPYNTTTMILQPYHYALITDQDTELYTDPTIPIPNSTLLLTTQDNTLGGYGLNNEAETLILKDSDNNTIDTLEYGDDNLLQPGYPTPLLMPGESIAHRTTPDTDNSILDHTTTKRPTPGTKNILTLDIDCFPLYIPKPYHDELPTSMLHVNLSSLPPSTTMHLKTYLISAPNQSNPSSQTWNGMGWMYSNNYTHQITTDGYGNWNGWIHLRINPDYQDYQDHLKDTGSAYLHVKIKTNETYYLITRNLKLLDLDETTRNATRGGIITGIITHNDHPLSNAIAILTRSDERIMHITTTENNAIDDTGTTLPGYHTMTAPQGENYTITYYDSDLTPICTTTDNTIALGYIDHTVTTKNTHHLIRRDDNTYTIPLTITNTGTKNDTIRLKASSADKNWIVVLSDEMIDSTMGTTHDTGLLILPSPYDGENKATITITTQSTIDPREINTLTITLEILAPDLTITKLLALNQTKDQQSIYNQGESITLKAYLKNQGTEDTTHPTTIAYYYDKKDPEHRIATRTYETITTRYQKYPQPKWDTSAIPPGPHLILAIADTHDNNTESSEANNQQTTHILLIDTAPDHNTSRLLITELYPATHPGLENEYITISNPTDTSIDLTNHYLSTNPDKAQSDQHKILFTENTIIPPNSSITITQNASAYRYETGEWPDYEYSTNSTPEIPQLMSTHKITLPNTKGYISLKNPYNHTIDTIIYNTNQSREYNTTQWVGSPIITPANGRILIRNKKTDIGQDSYQDSNDASDWLSDERTYKIGQSRFSHVAYTGLTGSITTFISPDNSYGVIVSALRQAQESIYFNIYEMTSPFLVDELIDALNRGVCVSVFIEGSPIGGINEREGYLLHKLHIHGADIRSISQDTTQDVYARYTYDHAKYMVIDNDTVIVESCNWAKTGIPKDPTYGNREWGVLVKNETLAQHYLSVFNDDFNPLRCDSWDYTRLNITIPEDYYPSYATYSGRYIPPFGSYTYNGTFDATPVFSPDNSHTAILEMIQSANKSIYIQQLYIYTNWGEELSPFVAALAQKALDGVDVRIMLNYNPNYESSNEQVNETRDYLIGYGAQVRYLYTNWSLFSNLHNKGMVIDNKSVLLSSINWNENSVRNNREAGIIIHQSDIATYYAEVFTHDWNLEESTYSYETTPLSLLFEGLTPIHIVLIVLIYVGVGLIILRDWRNRQWSSSYSAQQVSSPSQSSLQDSLSYGTRNSVSPSDSSSSISSHSSSPLPPTQQSYKN